MPTPMILFLSLTLSTALLYLAIRRRRRSTNSGRLPLPPGPTPLPLVGNIFELGDQPHRSLALLAKTHGPVMSLRLGTNTTVVVSSAAAAREALQTKDQSLSARFVPDVVTVLDHASKSIMWLDSSSPLWKTLRTVVKSHLFTNYSLDAGQSLRCQKVRELLAHVRGRAGQPVDIGQLAFATSLNLLSNSFFSIDVVDDLVSESAHWFWDLVREMVKEASALNLSDFFPALRLIDPQGHRRGFGKHLKKFYGFLDEMIDKRLQEYSSNPTVTRNRDFLDQLLGVDVGENKSKLNRAAVRTLLSDMFVAGTDTSSNTLDFAMAELLRNPSSMERARAELAEVIGRGNEVEESDIDRLPYLQAVVKETFRLHSTVPLLLPHQPETAVELGGYSVPKGCRLLVNVWAIGRAEEVWKDPESFSPERFLGREVESLGRHFDLLPYGSGRRICPGMPLAHRMVHLILASLINSFDWGLPEGMKPEDVTIVEKFGFVLAMAVPVPAIPMPIKAIPMPIKG